MHSTKLPPPLIIDDDYNVSIEHFYENFKVGFMDKNKRPRLFGKFIYVNCRNWIEKKSDTFWHLIAFDEGESESFNILPCNNDVAQEICPENCIIKQFSIELNTKKRDLCLYRGARINWISPVIELANKQDPNIQYWRKQEYNFKKRMREGKTYIRFKHETVDYLIVLAEKYNDNGELNNYHFITAFPVFYLNKKRLYDKDYLNFINTLEKK
ncbi:hypothetical protein [Paenibacillus barengoltzii]|uniref:hypothetical protein n=1 Tax=Paenibacillus barengoltzii TaxID=343517 RepID=UPI000FDC439A|nr:hypothetical protein [Paenibacillus barengoltzii]